jgi:dienelactone hydrolase
MTRIILTLAALLLAPLPAMHAADATQSSGKSKPNTAQALETPSQLWADYDPNAGDFKEEIVRDETKDGIYCRESYISCSVLDLEIRVFCLYKVKAGAVKAPGLLNVHGWMGAAAIPKDYVDDGWAVMSFDYCGKTRDRKQYTKYPDALRHGNMDRTVCGPVNSQSLDGKPITDPRQTSDYVWYAIQRRVLSYLERQKEVDRSRIGAQGYSYGGTLMWNLGTDPRVKAIVAYFGIGYTEYYRNKQVWMYAEPPVDPPKSSGEEIYLASVAAEAHVPFITAATLFLNGSNDHHGGHERGLESFKQFKPGVPWAFAIQARGHHDTEKVGQDAKLWLEKYVLGKEVAWPEHPQSELKLDANGVPQLVVAPAVADRVKKVEMFYALKNPCSFNRSWRDAVAIRQGDTWVASLPVLGVDDYVFGYANITYDNTIVLSTDFNAAIPSKLGNATATDKPSDVIASSSYGEWTNIAEVEGPKGIKGFRSTNNQRGSGTEQLYDPKWRAPANASLGFKFYCTEPQTVILSGGDHNQYAVTLEIGASDEWQEMPVPADHLISKFDQKPMKGWSAVGNIHLQPKPGSDLTKVLFADFRWLPGAAK